MFPRPPTSTRTDTLFPYTTRFRSRATVLFMTKVFPRPAHSENDGSCPFRLRHWSRHCSQPAQQQRRRQYWRRRSEEHTSELQSLMRISYAVFCLKKKNEPIIIRQLLTKTNITKCNTINIQQE